MALLLLAALLLLVGLTRTQAGRDELGRRIERTFAREFEGEIEIGRLQGDLIQNLHASGLRLRDPEGRVVIEADSAVLAPRWLGLLSRRLLLDRITLVRPRIALVLSEDGRWNLEDALAKRRPSTEPGDPLGLEAASIRILEGTLTTANEGARPEAVRAGTLFDYTNATLAGLEADLDVFWTDERKRLEVRRLSAEMPGLGVRVRRLEGALAVTDGQLRLRDLAFETEGSRVAGAFTLSPREGEAAVLELALAPSRISGEELRRVLPALPLADAVDLEARLRGPLDALDVEALRVARGPTALALAGTVRGLPERAAFDLRLARSALRAEDLEAVLPALALPQLHALGTVALSLEAGGEAALAGPLHLRTDARFDLATAAGDARGRVRLGLEAGRPVAYDLEADIRGVDPGKIAGEAALAGSLTGRLALAGAGLSRDDLEAELRLALTESRLAGRAFEGLTARLAADGLRLSGTTELTAGGALRLAGEADLGAATFDLDAWTSALDLRRLLPEAPATRLHAEARLVGSGARLDDFAGEIALRLGASAVALGDTMRMLPADTLTLVVAPEEGGRRRMVLEGGTLAAEAEGAFAPSALVRLAGAWGGAVARTVQAEGQKFYRPPADSLHLDVAASRPPAEGPRQAVRLALEVRDPEALRALLPELPGLAPGTALDLSAALSSDSLALAAIVRGDSLLAPGLESGPYAAEIRLRSCYGATLAGRSDLAVDVRSGALRLPIGPLAEATAGLRYRDRRATITARSERLGEDGRLELEASLALEPERNRLALHTLAVTAGGQSWRAEPGAGADLYADAIVTGGLTFAREHNGGPPQRLVLAGTLSARPEDTLAVRAEALDVNEVLTLIGLDDLFDGRLEAELAVAAALGQPIVVGEAAIARFAFAGRRAGKVALTSRFVPGSDAVAVELRLRPDGHPASTENDLRAGGTIRFPGRDARGRPTPGALDLALDLRRVDLFLFDWLFPDIVAGSGGYATGTGRVTGTPRVPLFEADLRVREGHTRIPDFGLALALEGRVTVDREGFHLHNVLLEDKAGGQGLVRGHILFNDYRYFSFDLAADLAEIEVIDVPASRDLPFYGHIRATGSATLTGPVHAAYLYAADATTTADSEIFIPVTASGPARDVGFLVLADSLGNVPEPEERRSLIAERPAGERPFLEGLGMNLNVRARPGSRVHLVFDPVIGDVITAVGSAELQLAIREGDFLTYGTFDVESGDYLFTAGDVFTRRFGLLRGGTLRWDGDPIDARLDLPAVYRTRASLAGLDLPGVDPRQRVPLAITMDVSGRVSAPLVDLAIGLDERERSAAAGEALRRRLNESDRQAEYATSVLLTNSFLLAPTEGAAGVSVSAAADELFFTSLSQLVSTRLSLFLNQALGADNLDVLVGVQQGQTLQDLDLTYGIALRLMDERLVIRGEGVYQRLENRPVGQELQGEVALEMRLTPAVSLEVFYRRESDVLGAGGLGAAPYGAYGAGVNYETEFESWRALLGRLLGRETQEPLPGAARASAE